MPSYLFSICLSVCLSVYPSVCFPVRFTLSTSLVHFRRAYLEMAASPESFLMLREHFARTLGAVNICQYILGIGDRHLSNFMIDAETGGVIGIDFGHAFGSATQFLPLPELMPFRLTQQFCNLLLPLKESGQLRSTMMYTLTALRRNPSLLLSTMDVFIKEPSLDWKVLRMCCGYPYYYGTRVLAGGGVALTRV